LMKRFAGGGFVVRYGKHETLGRPKSESPNDLCFWACSAAVWLVALDSIRRGARPGDLPSAESLPVVLPEKVRRLAGE
jgi:hypothetical protein